MDLRFLKTITILAFLMIPALALSGPFDELDSYDRQQRAAEEGFKDFDREFAEPTKSAPVQRQRERVRQEAPRQAREQPVKNVPQVAVVNQEPEKRRRNQNHKTYIKDGIRFSLEGCEKTSGEVSCSFTVLSEDTDENLTFFTSTNFYDDNGNQYKALKGKIANTATWGDRASHKLIRGVSAKVKVDFQNVSERASKMSLFEVIFHARNSIKLTFRDVPLI